MSYNYLVRRHTETPWSALSALVERLCPGLAGKRAADVLRAGPPDRTSARIDSQTAFLAQLFNALEASWRSLVKEERQKLLQATDSGERLLTGTDRNTDALALALLRGEERQRVQLRPFLVALCRLFEHAQRSPTEPLDTGFEPLLARRLRRRFGLLPDRKILLLLLDRHRQLALEEPDNAARVLAAELERPLTRAEREWLKAERMAGILRFLRHNKNNSLDGHISWYVRLDAQGRPVLARLGVPGYWLVVDGSCPQAQVRVGCAAAQVYVDSLPPDNAWNVVSLSRFPLRHRQEYFRAGLVIALPRDAERITDSAKLRERIRFLSTHTYAKGRPSRMQFEEGVLSVQSSARALEISNEWESWLTTQDGILALYARRRGESERLLASLRLTASESEILTFLQKLDRVSELAKPLDTIAAGESCHEPVLWARALLQLPRPPKGDAPLSDLVVRIIYIPSAIPHQLGGLPKVGAAFICDHLERLGAKVDFLEIPPNDFESRIAELLGADVIGIGVYIHNKAAAATLIELLHAYGFQGRIILGGPEVRNIESVLESFPRWDAVIRGEAEESLIQVIKFFQMMDESHFAEALALARRLHGVVLRHGDLVLLCDISAKSKASAIQCPLPYGWSQSASRHLKMNFTRGCPYVCTFCPNHQGRRFRAGALDELWKFAVLAVADDLPLPEELEHRLCKWIGTWLEVPIPPRVTLALEVLLRRLPEQMDFLEIRRLFDDALHPRIAASGVRRSLVTLGLIAEEAGESLPGRIWQAKETWLWVKASLLASQELWQEEQHVMKAQLASLTIPSRPPFVIETSEDNTLVNREVIQLFLERRQLYRMGKYFIFNPGQNTIRDLMMRGSDNADEAFISRLVEGNPFAIAFGADGSSNAVLQHNRKPSYGITGILAVNRALSRRGVEIANNYILLTPEVSLLEAAEVFLLFLLLPIRWRDYGEWINLRVAGETTTLATDEGIIFASDLSLAFAPESGEDVPLRHRDLQELLDRWCLSSQVASRDLRALLHRILAEDPVVSHLLPFVLERWRNDLDADPELFALAQLIDAESRSCREPLVQTLWRVEERIRAEAFAGGRTTATFRELAMLAGAQ